MVFPLEFNIPVAEIPLPMFSQLIPELKNPSFPEWVESQTLERALTTFECKLCDGNFKPDNVIPGSDITCSNFAASAALYTNTTQCETYINNPFLQVYCGCPSVESACKLCDGNFKPDNVLPGTNMTCSTIAAAAAFYTNLTQCETDIKDPSLQAYCGCPLPESACKLCDGNIPDPNLVISPNFTCTDGEIYTASLATNESQCKEYNAVLGGACNCKNVPIASCNVFDKCPQGKRFDTVPLYDGPEFSCGQALLSASLGSVECNEVKLIEKCCVDKIASPSGRPSASPSGRPSASPSVAPNAPSSTTKESTSRYTTPNTVCFLILSYGLVFIW